MVKMTFVIAKDVKILNLSLKVEFLKSCQNDTNNRIQ